MVMVAIPREQQRVSLEFSAGLRGVIRGPRISLVLASAMVLTAALAVPRVGIVLAGVVLALAGSACGEVIRRASRAEPDEVRSSWWRSLVPRSIPKALLCALMAAGTVGPLWGLNPGFHRSPHWTPIGLLIAGAAWVVLPVAMLCAHACDRHGRLGARRSLILLAWHPIATLVALAVVPASLAFADAALGLAFYLQGNLPFFALEFMPMPDEPILIDGVPFYHWVDYRSYPETRFIAAYLGGLGKGYSLSGAIPASLSLPTRAGLNPSILGLVPATYFALRMLLALGITSCLLVAFAVQARWLGTIAAVEKKRPA